MSLRSPPRFAPVSHSHILPVESRGSSFPPPSNRTCNDDPPRPCGSRRIVFRSGTQSRKREVSFCNRRNSIASMLLRRSLSLRLLQEDPADLRSDCPRNESDWKKRTCWKESDCWKERRSSLLCDRIFNFLQNDESWDSGVRPRPCRRGCPLQWRHGFHRRRDTYGPSLLRFPPFLLRTPFAD